MTVTYGYKITMSDLSGGQRIWSVGGFPSAESAREAAFRLAKDDGWKPAKWWQWWRWRDQPKTEELEGKKTT